MPGTAADRSGTPAEGTLAHGTGRADPDATRAKATELARLHRDPTLLTVVNVWDVITARVVAQVEGTKALATASHSIAASWGYEDGENIPRDLMLENVARIVAATDLPVTADLESGYGDAAETVRRAIGVGAVGANIEDRMRPLSEAVRAVEAIMRVADEEGVDFQLNARTDAYSLRRDRDPEENLAEAITRCRAFLEAGAPVVFVPGRLSEEHVGALVDTLGPQRLTLIGVPGSPPLQRLEELGVARVSYGPLSQNVALTALQELVEDVQRGGGVPASMRVLN